MRDAEFVRRVVGVMSLDQGIMNPYEPMYTPERTVAISHLFTPAALQMWMSRVLEVEMKNPPVAPVYNSNQSPGPPINSTFGSRNKVKFAGDMISDASSNNASSNNASHVSSASNTSINATDSCTKSRRNSSFKIPTKKHIQNQKQGYQCMGPNKSHSITRQQRKRIPIILGMIEPDSTVSPSRIPNMSLGEMRKCLNEVRTLAPEDINPDRALSNGMLLGNFSIAFVNNSSNISASPISSQYSSQASLASLSVIKRSISEPPRRLKQTSLTNYIGNANKVN